uniref:Putative secreted protein n=1 Tax=Panstrongylus lignarius TaxID=156445 RepID=A0A224XT18_9HEMI
MGASDVVVAAVVVAFLFERLVVAHVSSVNLYGGHLVTISGGNNGGNGGQVVRSGIFGQTYEHGHSVFIKHMCSPDFGK